MSLGVPAVTGGATATSKCVADPSRTCTLGVGPETAKIPPPMPNSGKSRVPGAAGVVKEILAVTVPPGRTVWVLTGSLAFRPTSAGQRGPIPHRRIVSFPALGPVTPPAGTGP